MVSAILFNLIILDSTGSELDSIIEASLTISAINLLGSFASKGIMNFDIKYIIEDLVLEGLPFAMYKFNSKIQ